MDVKELAAAFQVMKDACDVAAMYLVNSKGIQAADDVKKMLDAASLMSETLKNLFEPKKSEDCGCPDKKEG